ncbi:hypothetical protein [Larkinella terrae]|uniref:Uncharacterized protein n=1 Tax=Larkinella terrae TaxID=2025311 RepID=A0A7K0EPX6_9BACT|nr:hypothetical protein [Larkinella terrae]MRS63885.1 hypothetical protein [Larkinella terrae]
MAVPFIRFTPPYDVHLLRGQSFQLISDGLRAPDNSPFVDLLKIGNSYPGPYIDAHPTHEYRFRFSFDETKAADFGIHVSNPVADPRKPDCLIRLDATEPALAENRIRNFYVYAQVIDTHGTPSPDDDLMNETAIRIHIHTAIAEVWLTPNPLTIYQGLYYRAELYARFDDGCIAKIGNSLFQGNHGSGFRYNISPAITVAWDSDTPGFIGSGFDTLRPQNLSGTHRISAEVSYNGTTLPPVRADVVISEMLTNKTSLRAELVATGFGPGFSKLDSVPNLLFLSEGFTEDQEFEFKSLVADYVYDLVSKKITSPFNLLKGSINYWMVFIPSREPGLATYGEQRVTEETNSINLVQLEGTTIPFIEKPVNLPVSDWTINHLLYFVGLPARFEGNSPDELLAEKWKATTNLTDGQVDDLIENNPQLVEEWKYYAERRLPDVPDTALGVRVNDYTAARYDDDYNMINLDAKRTHRDYLDDFFYGLRDAANNPVGRTFIKSPQSTPEPTLPQGKDWDNIVIITAFKRGRAQNEDGYMFSNIGSQDFDELTGDLTHNRVSIEPVTMPFKIPPGLKGTITHEICHSFGLGDEYGESPPSNSFIKKPVNHPDVIGWAFANFEGDGASLDNYSNLQAKADLKILGTDGTPLLNPYHIKWRYHLMQKCGIVTAVSVNVSTLTLTLQPRQAAQFAAGSPVFLRKRKKDGFAYRISETTGSPPVSISLVLHPDPVPPEFVGDSTVRSIDPAQERVTIEKVVGFGATRQTVTLDLTLESGKAVLCQPGQSIRINQESRPGPIFTTFRSATGEIEKKAISPLLTISSVNASANQFTLNIPADFPDFLKTKTSNDDLIVYQPVDMPDGQRSLDYPHKEIIAKPVLDYLLVHSLPFNAHSGTEVIDTGSSTEIPSRLVPCCSKREREIIGLYSGGARSHGGIYHPAAQCMMRHHATKNGHVELCAVCRYTLINLIDPTQFGAFTTDYLNRKIYPD